MRHVGILPLDDRPSHNEIVKEICTNVHDIKFHYVDQSILGHFTDSGNTELIIKRLWDLAKICDTLIISVDSLVFGGLVQSRMFDEKSLDEYFNRLEEIKKIKNMYPKIQIFAYSIIIRLTTTVTDSQSIEAWKNIYEYSKLSDQIKFDPSVKEKLERIKNKVSQKEWISYIQTRERNHEINKKSVQFANEGIINHLTLVQEDTHQYGPHRQEQHQLKKLIDPIKFEKNIFIKNGADEMVALYVAKILNRNYCIQIFDDFIAHDFIALYEDMPVLEGLKLSLDIANISLVNNYESDVCVIIPTVGSSMDLSMEKQKNVEEIDSEFMSKALNVIKDRNYGILDIKDANGGDIRYVDNFVEKTGLSRLHSYSAWNTANNSIGTFLLQMVVANYYTIPENIIKLRIIDDALYQGTVRFEYNQYLKKNGYDIWKMNKNLSNSEVLERMLQAEIVKHPYLNIEVSAYLPWGRSFEVVIGMKKKEYDVIVVGGGSAGVSAAIASARTGAKTLLVDKSTILGGTNTRSLVGPITTFLGEDGTKIVGGIPQEIIDNLIAINGSLGHIPDPIGFCHSLTPVNFKMMQLVLFNMIDIEDNLEIMLDTTVKNVLVKDSNISCLICERENEIFTLSSKIIIDASGDAVVVSLASNDFEVGRESDGKTQPMSMLFTCRGVDLEKVRDDVKKDPSNFAVSEEIKDGKRMGYVAISGYFKEVLSSQDFPLNRDRILFFQGINEDEVGVNTTRIYSDYNKSINDYSQDGQKQVYLLFEWLKKHICAFRNSYISDIGEIGVRESRRVIGDLQLKSEDVMRGAEQEESIAVGSYPIDIHSPDSKNMEFQEESPPRDFEISYRMLLPKSLDNVIVAGRAISATHSAHAASRVSATCMAIGQSAGVAAAIVSKEGITTRDVHYPELKEKIIALGGIPTKMERN